MNALNLPSHVIAALFEFNYSLAAVASLPALLFGHLDDTVGLLVLGAFALGVEFTIAKHTDLGVACAASCVLAAICGIHLDLGWLDPLSTSLCWAVETVSGGVLLELSVPEYFELVIE